MLALRLTLLRKLTFLGAFPPPRLRVALLGYFTVLPRLMTLSTFAGLMSVAGFLRRRRLVRARSLLRASSFLRAPRLLRASRLLRLPTLASLASMASTRAVKVLRCGWFERFARFSLRPGRSVLIRVRISTLALTMVMIMAIALTVSAQGGFRVVSASRSLTGSVEARSRSVP